MREPKPNTNPGRGRRLVTPRVVGGASIHRALGTIGADPPPNRRCPVIVGRGTELDALRRALESAGAGQGSTILLGGPAGTGKSRLLREVRAWCLDLGWPVITGRAVESAAAEPFRPVAEALLTADRTGAIRDEPDVAPFRRALAGLVPGLATETTCSPEAPPLLHVAEGFLRVARGRGRAAGGVAILLEDLHWADPESLEVLGYLADNISDQPILVVVTARAEPDRPQVRALLELVDRRSATLLRLGRLDPQQTARMTAACISDTVLPAELSHLVHERSGGVPFLVEEVIARLIEDRTLVRDEDGWVLHDTGDPAVTGIDDRPGPTPCLELGPPTPRTWGSGPAVGGPDRPDEHRLTTRETEVLALVSAGMPNRDIAARLFVSVRTVEKHVERLLAKTDSRNRSQLATYAVQRGSGGRTPRHPRQSG